MAKTPPSQGLTIGDLAARSGLAVSAIRFYETHDIVKPLRNAGGHRRYSRADLRRLSFALIAQGLGFSLSDIGASLAQLPDDAAPSRADWTRMAKGFRRQIDDRIAALTALADNLDGCIGCGCLSLDRCTLYNSQDRAAAKGPGPRYLMGDRSD
ncbi:redox-sensitive transcriptional activator SoxR [Flavimaricola marinus]|uniref:Redox-sensitive transcriptional activator SoxR n=1 Tax=Flavimaricola marinus TaxID=1819565 RepID=A0A238LDX1_9RHOB|nr:redox-sensitive transcriptional activator SoxR [Flavimaricola marinus]SMY07624.1 Redox-sensitive transcriptional activator SoxR [Flavimaricola marinus]